MAPSGSFLFYTVVFSGTYVQLNSIDFYIDIEFKIFP
jgi:hypothetical protein